MVASKAARIPLALLEVLMGIAAVGGGVGLVLTNGLGMPAEWMESSPFGSYTVPGLVLLLLVGSSTSPAPLVCCVAAGGGARRCRR